IREPARVVQGHVEAAHGPIRLLDHPLDVLAPRDVGADRDLAELGGHLSHAGVEVGQHEPGAVGREPPRARRADPARRTRDEHNPSVELSHCRTSVLVSVYIRGSEQYHPEGEPMPAYIIAEVD